MKSQGFSEALRTEENRYTKTFIPVDEFHQMFMISLYICVRVCACERGFLLAHFGPTSTSLPRKAAFPVNNVHIRMILADGIQSQIRMSSLSTAIKMNEDPGISTFQSV